MNIRRIEANDLTGVLACNLHNLPENYSMQSWACIILTWPDLSFLAEDGRGKVVGYVLSSIEHEEGDSHSQAWPCPQVDGSNHAEDAMIREDATLSYLQLHVRKSNRVAQSLYNKLGYKYHGVEEKYYADDEDAWIMWFPIRSETLPQRKEEPSPDTQRRVRNTCLADFWHFLQDKSSWLVGAAMGVIRRTKSRQ